MFPIAMCLQRADFATPSLLRRSLGLPLVPPPGFEKTQAHCTAQLTSKSVLGGERLPIVVRRFHGSRPLPGFWSAVAARTCLTTNWAGFFQALHLPGSDAEQAWHVPLFCDGKTTLGDACIIFRPREGETAVLAFSRHIDFSGQGAGLPPLQQYSL